MKQRWELERLEEERKQMEAFRQKAELGCVSEGPHSSQAGGPLAFSDLHSCCRNRKVDSLVSSCLTTISFFLRY